jgi:hypothetical protein
MKIKKRSLGDMNENIRTFARLGLVDTYLEIAVDSFLEFQKNKKEYEIIVSGGGFLHKGIFIYSRMDDYTFYEDSLRKDTIKTTIFLTTFLEAYIYDFGCIVLGDNYTKEHLDKLNLISKWIVIPRLITGKEIDKSKAFFSDFKCLIKFRNKLVHHKSKDATPLFNPDYKLNENEFKSIHEMIELENLFRMLKELFEELDRIDEKGCHLLRIRSKLEKVGINVT